MTQSQEYPKVSIIIISYNTSKITCECLKSIINADNDFSYEIIIIDNASIDDSVITIKQNFPSIQLIENQQNSYFAKANNQGAKIAKGKYLLLLNSDTLVYKNNLTKLVNYLDSTSEKVACVGPMILNEDGSIQSMGHPKPSLVATIIGRLGLHRLIPWPFNFFINHWGFTTTQKRPTEAGWISGACILTKKDIFLKMGGFNENLIFYGEEPELCYKLSQRNFITIFFPLSSIIHLGGKSTKKGSIVSPENENISHERYAYLVSQTIGYKKAIVCIKIGILCIQFKKMITRNPYYLKEIKHEKAVLNILRKKTSTKSTTPKS